MAELLQDHKSRSSCPHLTYEITSLTLTTLWYTGQISRATWKGRKQLTPALADSSELLIVLWKAGGSGTIWTEPTVTQREHGPEKQLNSEPRSPPKSFLPRGDCCDNSTNIDASRIGETLPPRLLLTCSGRLWGSLACVPTDQLQRTYLTLFCLCDLYNDHVFCLDVSILQLCPLWLPWQ